jgi:hypothetical protein
MGNAYYAGWVLSMAKRPQICQDFGTENQEVLGDIVEAALGICYLCTIFPTQLDFVMRRPNTMWRRMETSMLQHTPASTYGLAKKRGGNVTVQTPSAVLELSRTLQENPIFEDTVLEGQLTSPTFVSAEQETLPPQSDSSTPADPHYLQTLMTSVCGYCNDQQPLESCVCVYAQFLRTVLINFRFVATSNWEKCDTLLHDILTNEQANKRRRLVSTPIDEPSSSST